MLSAKILSRLPLAALVCALAVAAILTSSCGSSEIEPRGKVIPYKIAKRAQFGIDTAKTVELAVVSYTTDIEQLQFVAQDLIIKENKADGNIHGITVGFYQNGPVNRKTIPAASMNWVREEPTFFRKMGLGGNNPFDVGDWQWTVSEPDGLNPSIVIDSVRIEPKTSAVTVKGHTAKRAKSITAIAMAPNLVAISKPIKGARTGKGNSFTINWKPPANLKPIEGAYILRIISGGTKATISELLVKVDLQKKKWVTPADVLLY